MYHCFFLNIYIGPPKVFFLSFGPLFKKFAHHWSRQSLWSGGNVVASHAAGSGFSPGRVSFLVEVFPRFFLNRKRNVRKFDPHSSPGIIWPS